jgi:hypothetical protein
MNMTFNQQLQEYQVVEPTPISGPTDNKRITRSQTHQFINKQIIRYVSICLANINNVKRFYNRAYWASKMFDLLCENKWFLKEHKGFSEAVRSKLKELINLNEYKEANEYYRKLFSL